MKEFVYGILFGIFLLVSGVFLLLKKTRVIPTLSIVSEKWPEELEEYIRKNTSRDDDDHGVGDIFMSPTMDIAWLNLIFTRLFLSLRSSSSYKETTLESISMKMNLNLKKGLLVLQVCNTREK